MRIDKTTTIAEEYANLKRQEKEVKSRLSEISPELTDWLQESGGFFEYEDGSELKIVTRKDWQYPKYVEEEVKSLKDKASKMQKIYQIKNPEKWSPNYNLRFDDRKEGGK